MSEDGLSALPAASRVLQHEHPAMVTLRLTFVIRQENFEQCPEVGFRHRLPFHFTQYCPWQGGQGVTDHLPPPVHEIA